jgi:leucyl aminopeptidase
MTIKPNSGILPPPSRQRIKGSKMKKQSPAKQQFDLLALPEILIDKPGKIKKTPIHLIKASHFDKWIASQSEKLKNILSNQGFKAKSSTVGLSYDDSGEIDAVYVGRDDKIGIYTICAALDKIGTGTFSIDETGLKEDDLTQIMIGWWLACYRFTAFKSFQGTFPKLTVPKGANAHRAESMARAIYLIRNLINLPPNALGPQALADAAIMVAKNFDASAKVIEDTDLLTENFPLIYAVGDGSERRPRLVDFTWGNPKHPKVTLVGKGVCFDTGGYDLKPSAAMLLMKKDMGGAAMALGLAYMVMSLELPICLRVLIPAVENSVSGRAYRPSDILNSRKGLTVEIGNTDAEGRLVMADCLTLACEEHPDLLIDFSTLTGAARTALGFEIPAMYSNDDKLAADLQKMSMQVEDPVWHMPLWQPYKGDILSPNADLNNSGNNPAGSITAALFLQSFVDDETNWIHLDHYAWEATGKPGRPKGGADTSMRAVLALLEKRYGAK